MIIYLIRPYYPENLKQQSFPLGLGYLASVLEKNGHEVKIFDLNMMGFTNQEFLKYLIKHHVDLIGVSGLTYDFFGMIELCKLIKKEEKLAFNHRGNSCFVITKIFARKNPSGYCSYWRRRNHF